jgi:hypothetical protein
LYGEDKAKLLLHASYTAYEELLKQGYWSCPGFMEGEALGF